MYVYAYVYVRVHIHIHARVYTLRVYTRSESIDLRSRLFSGSTLDGAILTACAYRSDFKTSYLLGMTMHAHVYAHVRAYKYAHASVYTRVHHHA